MRPILILPSALIVCALAGAAAAQQAPDGQAGRAAGLRYLSWPGKTAPAPVRAVETAPAPTPAPVSGPVSSPLASPVPLARIAPVATPAAARPGLTPASAWMPPKAEAASAPVAYAAAPAAQPPTTAPAPAPPPEAQPRPQPEAQPEAQPAVDPMAPRADAPIFRLQRPAATPASTPDVQAQAAPPAPAYPSSARYYSLHRQAGHAPDAIATPQPVYLDALPVELAQTPQSADLAEPPATPSLMRGADGRLMAAPPQIEGDSLP